MNANRLERLAHDELDGTATPPQLEELKGMLAESEEARTRYEEIRQVFQILGSRRPLEPPPSLKPHVLSAVRAGSPRAPRFAALGRARPLGYACAFAAGALIVLAFTSGGRLAGGGSDPAVSGAMAPVRGLALDHQRVEWPGGSAECGTWRSGDRVSAIATIQAGQWTEMELDFDPALVRVVQARPPGGEARLEITPGRVRFAARDGDCALELIARGTTPTIAMVVRGAGNVTPRRIVKLF